MNFQRIQYPAVGFRVEVREPGHKSNNNTIRGNGDMLPRDPFHPLDATAFRDHLAWEKVRGPLISFTTSWGRAMRRRDRYIHEEGAQDVVVIAVWLKGLVLYDAFDVAQQVNLDYHQVGKHLDEVLLHGCVEAGAYRILATFYGSQTAKMVELSLPRFTARFLAPPNLPGLPEAMDERLQYEMYSHTGVLDIAKYFHLALSMCNQTYTVDQNGMFRLHFP